MIIFPNDSLNKNNVDPYFEHEYNICKKINIPVYLFDFDLLFNKKIAKIHHYKKTKLKTCFLRSWVLLPELYEILYFQLYKKYNIQLINSPSQYKLIQYKPHVYEYIKNNTSKLSWIVEKILYYNKDIIFKILKNKISIFDNKFYITDFSKISKNIEPISKNIEINILYEKIIKFVDYKKKYKQLYGGIVFNEFINYDEKNIKRYFILDEKDIFSNKLSTNKIPVNFYFIDIINNSTIYNTGDVQVALLNDINKFYHALKIKLFSK
jgi:hypothetical protein